MLQKKSEVYPRVVKPWVLSHAGKFIFFFQQSISDQFLLVLFIPRKTKPGVLRYANKLRICYCSNDVMQKNVKLYFKWFCEMFINHHKHTEVSYTFSDFVILDSHGEIFCFQFKSVFSLDKNNS